MKHCPHCPGSLESHKIHNSPCYLCHVCEGLWFEKKELLSLLFTDFLFLNQTELNKARYNKSSKKTMQNTHKKQPLCPLCTTQHPLNNFALGHNVYVPFCSKTQSIWLEKGEIQKQRKTFLKKLTIFFLIVILLSIFVFAIKMTLSEKPSTPPPLKEQPSLNPSLSSPIAPYSMKFFIHQQKKKEDKKS